MTSSETGGDGPFSMFWRWVNVKLWGSLATAVEGAEDGVGDAQGGGVRCSKPGLNEWLWFFWKKGGGNLSRPNKTIYIKSALDQACFRSCRAETGPVRNLDRILKRSQKCQTRGTKKKRAGKICLFFCKLAWSPTLGCWKKKTLGFFRNLGFWHSFGFFQCQRGISSFCCFRLLASSLRRCAN